MNHAGATKEAPEPQFKVFSWLYERLGNVVSRGRVHRHRSIDRSEYKYAVWVLARALIHVFPTGYTELVG